MHKFARLALEQKINNLPNAWQAYRTNIIDSAKLSVRFRLEPNDELTPWDSKVGGQPYLPLDMAYPTNNHGEPLFLLAQINFAQLPKLPNYPDTGILQIFIASDDLYGADFEQPQNQNGFCMIYHKTVITDPNQLQHDFPTNADEDGLPIDNQPYALIAKGVELQPMTWADHQFDDKVVNLRDFASNHGYDTLDIYEYVLDTVGHRLGGNPYCTQGDIRAYGDYQDYVLLFSARQ